MNLSRPEREQVRQIVQRAVMAQTALDFAKKSVDEARSRLDAATREHTEAMKAFRDWTANNTYLPLMDGSAAVLVDGQVHCRPIQSVDEIAPAAVVTAPPVTEPQPSKPVRRAK